MPIYRIVCHNGEVFVMGGFISNVVEEFKKKTGLREMDIHTITNLH